MGIVIRRGTRVTLVTYLGFAIGYVNAFVLFPLILTPAEIGFVRILLGVSALFAAWASVGAVWMPGRFFPFFNDRSRGHRGFLLVLLLIAMGGFLCFLGIFLGFRDTVSRIYLHNSNLIVDFYYLFIPMTFVVMMTNVFAAYIVVQGYPTAPAVAREVLYRVTTTIAVLLLFLGLFRFSTSVIVMTGGYTVSLLVLVGFIYRKGILFLKPKYLDISRHELRLLISFGLFTMFGAAASTVISNIDNLMLSAYKGLSSAGIYSIAFLLATIIEVPKRAVSQAALPMISQANKDWDIPKLRDIYKKSSLNELLIGGLLFLLVWCNVDTIFKLIPNGSTYAAGKWVVFYIGISKLFDMLSGTNQEIVGTSRYYKLDILFYVLLGLLAIVTNLYLIPRFGIVGAAIASAASVFLYNVTRYVLIAILFKIQPFSLDTLKGLAILMAAFCTNLVLPSVHGFLIELVVKSTVLTAIVIGASVAFKVSSDINGALFRTMDRVFRRG